MRIENLSLRFNLVSSNSRGHQKRTKKIKREREQKEEEELENHCMCSGEELRRKKKNGERGQSRIKLKPLDSKLSIPFRYVY